jgi:hypothetical protein
MSDLDQSIEIPWYHSPCDVQCVETKEDGFVICPKCALILFVGRVYEPSSDKGKE